MVANLFNNNATQLVITAVSCGVSVNDDSLTFIVFHTVAPDKSQISKNYLRVERVLGKVRGMVSPLTTYIPVRRGRGEGGLPPVHHSDKLFFL